MSMTTKLTIEHQKDTSIDKLYLHGYLDMHTAPQLESSLDNLIKTGRHNILVNFRGLDYISSAGLGVFMVFIEDVRLNGGDIKLTEMKPKIFTVFDLLGFPMLFDISENEIDALAKFAP